ncbi:hypothetical protein [Saccharopolyspora shandongensis]|uniref:hypothetical protein n=1 Tax=Saccharopolyspora shandongensis TaxID=418495 RepID=UPI0033EED7A6
MNEKTWIVFRGGPWNGRVHEIEFAMSPFVVVKEGHQYYYKLTEKDGGGYAYDFTHDEPIPPVDEEAVAKCREELERKQKELMDKQMTAGQLIKELSKYPKNIKVWTDGCDCSGRAGGVKEGTAEDGKKVLTIMRVEEGWG